MYATVGELAGCIPKPHMWDPGCLALSLAPFPPPISAPSPHPPPGLCIRPESRSNLLSLPPSPLVGSTMYMRVSAFGIAEAQYERFDLYIDSQKVLTAQASNK